MEKVRIPFFKIIYAGKDITEEITEFLTSIRYVDNVTGAADEIDITLDNSDLRWMDAWYPAKNDEISFEWGYDSRSLTNGGIFYVDEIELDGPPDIAVIKCQSTGLGNKLRTRKTKGYEQQTLKQIAKSVADANGLELVDSTPVTDTYGSTTGDLVSKLNAIDARFEALVASYTSGMSTGEDFDPTNPTIGEMSIGEVERRYEMAGPYRWIYPTYRMLREELKGLSSTYNARFTDQAIDYFIYGLQADGAPSGLGAPLFYHNPDGSPGGFNIEPTYSGNLFDVPLIRIWRREMSELIAHVQALGKKVLISSRSALESLTLQRSTQHRETDLEYLKRLCEDLNFAFSVKGNKLVFISLYKLHAEKPVQNLDRREIARYTLRDRTESMTLDTDVNYFNPDTGATPTGTSVIGQIIGETVDFIKNKNADGVDFNTAASPDYGQGTQDSGKDYKRADSNAVAMAMAQAKMHKQLVRQRTVNISMEGNEGFVAGINFNLTGFGKCSGKYFIDKSTHTILKNQGYTTQIDASKNGTVPASTVKASKKSHKKYGIASSLMGQTVDPKKRTNADKIDFNQVKR